MKSNNEKPLHSITALQVTQGLLACAHTQEWSHLVNLDAASISERLVEIAQPLYPVTKGSLALSGINLFPYSAQKTIFDLVTNEGYAVHCAMRKLFIEQQVIKSIEQGVTQVLIMGGGFDTLALRLHPQFPLVQFYELDRGHTRDAKLTAVKHLTQQLGENMHFVECDLGQPNWHLDFSSSQPFNKENKTILICEGLTMYLTEAEVSDLLLIAKNHLLNDEGTVILSFNEPKKQSTLDVAKATIRAESNENYKCQFSAADVPTFLLSKQFSVQGKVLGVNFQRQAGNEKAVLAYLTNPEKTKSENYYVLYPTDNMGSSLVTLDINDIPDINITIPEKKEEPEHQSNCLLS